MKPLVSTQRLFENTCWRRKKGRRAQQGWDGIKRANI